MGLTPEGLQKLSEWAQKRTVTLRFRTQQDCVFDRTVEREVESSKHTTFIGSLPIYSSTVKDKIIEHFWRYSYQFELFAYEGNDPETKFVFASRKGNHEIVTSQKENPQEKRVADPNDLNISWLFQNLKNGALSFSIDRSQANCKTPRRNEPVERALQFYRELYFWTQSIATYFQSSLFPIQKDHGLNLSLATDTGLFVPVVPLFEEKADNLLPESADSTDQSSPLLTPKDCSLFLMDHRQGLEEKLAEMAKMFPVGKNLITVAEVTLVVLMTHLSRLAQHISSGVNYVEQMLYNQLTAALGKVITEQDFSNYMLFHNRRMFSPKYVPKPFSFAIRRPNYSPEGVVSIQKLVEGTSDPIYTMVSSTNPDDVRPMYFPINASTRVRFTGERYLHGWIDHSFQGKSSTDKLLLSARARQFSSFILILGTIVSIDVFEPSHAIIIQNQDDLSIPLGLETIPTPKEFQDAIESLSPEQQRFCKAYRGMQLASTLFGLCVLQIKPQLEKLLNLPFGALTKELRLTQDLLELFIEYEIPSDLLSFGGCPREVDAVKVDTVKKHVDGMRAMIKVAKDEEQREAEEARKMELLRQAEEARQRAEVENRRQSQTLASIGSFFGGFGGGNMSLMKQSAPASEFSFGAMASVPYSMPTGGLTPNLLSAPVVQPALEPSKPDPSPVVDSREPDQKPADKPQDQLAPFKAPEVHGEPDYTLIPPLFDKKFLEFDPDSALRPTIIKPQNRWTLKSRKNLLTEAQTRELAKDDLKKERAKAFDLIDALTKSGELPFTDSSFHVVIASTHGFVKSLVDTIIQENRNPIENLERSNLIVATTIHSQPASSVLNDGAVLAQIKEGL